MLNDQAMKEVYCSTLLEEMERHPEIVLLEADLMGATGTKPAFEKYPERCINVGIAEANMVGVAAGLASFGKIPVCASFSAFLSRRDFDQICISACYAKLNVKFVGTDPGICAEKNGGTHTAFEDVALMRALPGMVIFEPCDAVQLRRALPQILQYPAPVYMRLNRKKAPAVYTEDYEFRFGKADTVRAGSDVTLIASGILVHEALLAAELLAQQGVSARVVNMHTIKPLDEQAILQCAGETAGIVTCENNNYLGGLGSAVAETLAEHDAYVPLRRVGIRDHFGDVGTVDYLKKRFHISSDDIAAAAQDVLARAKR